MSFSQKRTLIFVFFEIYPIDLCVWVNIELLQPWADVVLAMHICVGRLDGAVGRPYILRETLYVYSQLFNSHSNGSFSRGNHATRYLFSNLPGIISDRPAIARDTRKWENILALQKKIYKYWYGGISEPEKWVFFGIRPNELSPVLFLEGVTT